MNHRPSGSMQLSKAIQGFIYYKQAQGLAPRTIRSYEDALMRWINEIGDVDVLSIDSHSIIQYMNWLKLEYQPKRYNGKTQPLSQKTLRNHWVTLSAFYTWVSNEFNINNIMKAVPAPKYIKKEVAPFTKEEIEVLLKACAYSREAETTDRKKFSMKRATAKRDEAIIMTLLDTGLRALELCSLTIGNLDMKTGQVIVEHGVPGGAKGGKGRVVYVGKNTRKAIWRYLASREDGEENEAPVFIGTRGHSLTPNALRHLIVSIAGRAGVANATPHRFRHTMAITYIRSGGDIFTLQALLGHGSLDMVRHYAAIAQTDVQAAHRKASPVDNWRL